MKIQNKKGFTLIELLVVITIIGILATGAVATYTSQIQKARDTTRVNEMKAMQTAVEQFYGDDTEYPDQVSTGTVGSYMPKIPLDGKNGQPGSANGATSTTLGYWYTTGEDSNGVLAQRYEISIAFESNGNVTSKADNSKDNGEDNNTADTASTGCAAGVAQSAARLEVGIPGSSGKLDLRSCSGAVVPN